jgi:hypothetical protein
MRFAPLLVTALLATTVLAGCATDQPVATDPPAVEPSASATPTPTPTPEGPIVDDPADFPVDPESGWGGVQFTVADDQIQCSIFDPTTDESPFWAAPYFGCVVNAPDFPYPPITGGPWDSANAFVSSGHEAGRETNVTDATFSGDGAAPALTAGHALTWSTVTCEALADDEVKCTDADSGHGVRVSARDFELF